jgi:hypothetical protein
MCLVTAPSGKSVRLPRAPINVPVSGNFRRFSEGRCRVRENIFLRFAKFKIQWLPYSSEPEWKVQSYLTDYYGDVVFQIQFASGQEL